MRPVTPSHLTAQYMYHILYLYKALHLPPQSVFVLHCIATRSLFLLDCVWNVTAHAQKPDFVFRRNGRVHLSRRGASVQSTTGRRAVRISLQGLYCSCEPVFCSHVTLTGYPLHSLVSPSHFYSRASSCTITFQLDSTYVTCPRLGYAIMQTTGLYCPFG
jgi:hypothetical protein